MPKAPETRTSTRSTRSDPLARTDANTSKKPAASNATKAKDASSKKAVKESETLVDSDDIEEIAADNTTEGTVKNSTESSKKGSETSGKGKATKSRASGDTKTVTVKGSTESSKKSEKSPEAVESYLFLIRLTNSDDPCITRVLSVASDLNFQQFHEVLQVAFGWASYHAWSFDVSKLLGPEDASNPFGQGPPLLTLQQDDDMADAFPDPEQLKVAANYTLKDIYDSEEYKGQVEVTYEYDHGDSWEHQIAFIGREEPSMRKVMMLPPATEFRAVCLAGEGHPCAEDCGSSPGWEDLKAAFKKKSDPDGRKAWYKTECANGDRRGLDPWKWDIFDVNDGLAKLFGVGKKGKKKN